MAEDVSEPDDRSRTQVGAAPLAPSGVTLPSRWELVRPLGSGGQAQVWLARDEEFSEWVAIKIFRDDLTEVQRERWRREVRLERSLHCAGPGRCKFSNSSADCLPVRRTPSSLLHTLSAPAFEFG